MSDCYVNDNRGGRKFIGGAAMARRRATNKGNRILLPGEKARSEQTLPSHLSPYERFFACLLRSTPSEFSTNKKDVSYVVWTTICKRVRLKPPQHPVLPSYTYRDYNKHFALRAALVLEEARHSITDGIAGMNRRQKRRKASKHDSGSPGILRPRTNQGDAIENFERLSVTLKRVEIRKKTDHAVLTFHKPTGSFGTSELASLRSGTVIACVQSGQPFTTNNIRLGAVFPFNREDVLSTRSFPIMFFEPVNLPTETSFQLEPVTSLLSEYRKYEACTNSTVRSVPFLQDLLGGQAPTHTRFGDEDEDGDTDDGNVVDLCSDDDSTDSSSHSSTESSSDSSTNSSSSQDQEQPNFSALNAVQERAASTFLGSRTNSITLVQGPPGTGKTTLLVSILCRLILQSNTDNAPGCIMVCAPTNKAISLLCSRFLDAIQSKKPVVNVVLVGDDDKLLGDGESDPEASRLRPIFLYTWVNTVLEDYKRIRKFLTSKHSRDWDNMCALASGLYSRLKNQLSSLPKFERDAAKKIALDMNSANADREEARGEIVNTIDRLRNEIQTWKNDSIWNQLIDSAHIVFCTLASAGTHVLKRSSITVGDLIVDEAAAATEPELYIPFQFSPKRLLAVGDPKQLPATVLSRRAVQLGLSKSLHERLMYDCNKEYKMLTVQYRMKPAISQFPSCHFYDSKIENSIYVSSPTYGSPAILQGSSYSFVQVSGKEQQMKSGSFENHAEAQAVVAMVEQLRRISDNTRGKWHSVDRIRIITFYQAQVSLIKRLLRGRRLGDVVVATVDSSQGCEADIVIVSFVRSNGGNGSSTVGFLSDDRRLNVALTRARHQLINVGNAEFMTTLENSTTMSKLSSDAFRRDCVLPWSSGLTAANASKRPKVKTEEGKAKRQRVESEGTGDKDSVAALQNNSVSPSDTASNVSDKPRTSNTKRARKAKLPPNPAPPETYEPSYKSERAEVTGRAKKIKTEEPDTAPAYGENSSASMETCDEASDYAIVPTTTKSEDLDTPVCVSATRESIESSDISDKALISDNPVSTKSDDLDDDDTSVGFKTWGHPIKREEVSYTELPASVTALETPESSDESEVVPETAATLTTDPGNDRSEESSSHLDCMAYFADI